MWFDYFQKLSQWHVCGPMSGDALREGLDPQVSLTMYQM